MDKSKEWYINQYEKTLDLLKQLEWSASKEDYDYNYEDELEYAGLISICPVCKQWEISGSHSADCTLAKLLYNHGETKVSK